MRRGGVVGGASRSRHGRRLRHRPNDLPDDVAGVVSFFRSDLARFVTGQNLVVDGGMTLPGAGVDGVVDRVKALLAGANGPMAGSGG
jgi:NAD(P)-dependent dehydrogenase (short-subunit alcohol dehydrogenase family)